MGKMSWKQTYYKRKKQLLKEILSSDGQQFHQYQRKEQSPLISNHWTQFVYGNPGPGLGHAHKCF